MGDSSSPSPRDSSREDTTKKGNSAGITDLAHRDRASAAAARTKPASAKNSTKTPPRARQAAARQRIRIQITRLFLCAFPENHADPRKSDRQGAYSRTEVNDMERNRRERESGVLSTVAELFDLPADVVAGLPRLEMVGSRQLYLEHHQGILAYSDSRIDINTAAGVLCVKGEGLSLLAMTAEELRIGGRLASVEWVK